MFNFDDADATYSQHFSFMTRKNVTPKMEKDLRVKIHIFLVKIKQKNSKITDLFLLHFCIIISVYWHVSMYAQ